MLSKNIFQVSKQKRLTRWWLHR